MKVVILAGGRGTRLGGDQPKPMVEIGGKPMLSHIMGIYRKHGYNDFIIATGYKGEMIRDYYEGDPSVVCLDTGQDAGTGERIKQCAMHITEPTFMLTYGDGLANVSIPALVNTHDRGVTVTAVHPPARFGQMVLRGRQVAEFNEKPHNQTEWINGGFMVVDTELAAKQHGQAWEFDVLPWLAKEGNLRAYKHTGFWHCMDVQRDVDELERLWKEGAPWL